MMSTGGGETKEVYDSLLYALRNFADATKLANSALASSCLVRVRLRENQELARPEALQEILTELLELLDLGASDNAAVLRARFWEGMTLQEFCESEYNPENLAIRTIQEKQKKGIYKLAAWFIEKEAACKTTVEIRPERARNGLVLQDEKVPREPPESSAALFNNRRVKYFSDDFSQYEIGHQPDVWKIASPGCPIDFPFIERVWRNNAYREVLVFPPDEFFQVPLDLVQSNKLFSPPYQVTVQFRFLDEASGGAGLVLAGHYGFGNRKTWVHANISRQNIQFELKEYSGGLAHEQKEAPVREEIAAHVDYWLRVIVSDFDKQDLSVYWSDDGQYFSHIMTTKHELDPVDPRVWAGLSTSGPKLPHVEFSSIDVTYGV